MGSSLADISLCVKERKPRRLRHRVRKRVDAIVAPTEHLQRDKVAHKVARQHKGAGQVAGAHVALNLGLVVKVRHVAQTAARRVADVQQGRVDEVGDAGGDAGVGDGAAVGEFVVLARGEVGRRDEEDGVRAGEGLDEGWLGVEVGLCDWRVSYRPCASRLA